MVVCIYLEHCVYRNDCDAGYFSLGVQEQCTICPEGYYCEYKTKGGILCDDGKYSEAGSTICTTCEAGYYCPITQGKGTVKF